MEGFHVPPARPTGRPLYLGGRLEQHPATTPAHQLDDLALRGPVGDGYV